MARAVQHLVVLLAGQPVAELTRTRTRSLRLRYLPDARSAHSTPLSRSLPLDSDEHVGPVVEAYLRGLVPESTGALDAIERRYGIDAHDVMDVLSVIGKDCAGAVQFCSEPEVEDTVSRPGALEAFSDGEIEARLDEMDTNEDASWTMPGEHWSLGGTQQKFALFGRDGGWFLAHGSQPTTHIVKPGIRRMKAQALAEHASMQVARRLGLDVASTQYRSFKSREAIVVERFDRAHVNGQVIRLHQEDLCQALGVEQKYEEHGGPTAADVLRLLREHAETSAEGRANAERFVDGLVYNTVIGAPDAHARNFAVLLDHESVRLAPMYDIASDFGHDMSSGNARKLSMSIGGTSLLDEVGAEQWRRFAGESGVDADRVLARVAELTEAAPALFAEVLAEVEDSDGVAAELGGRIDAQLTARRHAAAT